VGGCGGGGGASPFPSGQCPSGGAAGGYGGGQGGFYDSVTNQGGGGGAAFGGAIFAKRGTVTLADVNFLRYFHQDFRLFENKSANRVFAGSGANNMLASANGADVFVCTSGHSSQCSAVIYKCGTANPVSMVGSFSTTTCATNTRPIARSLSVSGTVTTGYTLTGNYTYFDQDGNAEGTSTYRWYRSDCSSGCEWTTISGASGRTYALTDADTGKYIAFAVIPAAQTGASPGYHAVSAFRGPVAYNAPPYAWPVNASGTAQRGYTLSGSYTYGDDEGNAQGASLFQWIRSDTSNAPYGIPTGTVIAGATAQTYKPAAEDVGKYIFFGVQAVASSGNPASGVYTHASALGPIADNAVPVASNVNITGTAQLGYTLTGSYTYSDAENNARGTPIVKWYRADSATGTNKTQITGATSGVYTLTAADLGKFLSFAVIPVASIGGSPGAEVASPYTAAVANNLAPVASNVSVSGQAITGAVQTCAYTYSDADNNAEGSSTFRWWRADTAAGANATQISGAASRTYTLVSADIGKYIGCTVTPVASAGVTPGTAVSSSFATGPVTVYGWSAFGSGASSSVYDLVIDGSGNLYAGGNFVTINGVTANKIAKWNGSAWSVLGTGMNGVVQSLTMAGNGSLYAGGYFTTAGGQPANGIAKWDGSVWSALGSGMGGTDKAIWAMTTDSAGNLYVGGAFTSAGGVTASKIAKWDGNAWSALGTGMNGNVYALLTDSAGNLYAGGGFGTAGGVSARSVAKWNGSAWSALGTGVYGTVYTLFRDSAGNLYAGGYFTSAGGQAASNVAKWNGSTWSALGSGIAGMAVYDLAMDGGGNLYAGGNFTTAGGVTANRTAKWNGSAWSALGSGTSGEVRALTVGAGNLYAGGLFANAGGMPASNIARWDTSKFDFMFDDQQPALDCAVTPKAVKVSGAGSAPSTACAEVRAEQEPSGEFITASPTDPVSLNALIAVAAEDVGKPGELLVVAAFRGQGAAQQFALTGETWTALDGSSLPAQAQIAALDAFHGIPVHQGNLPLPGAFTLYTGYRLADGSVVFNLNNPRTFHIANSVNTAGDNAKGYAYFDLKLSDSACGAGQAMPGEALKLEVTVQADNIARTSGEKPALFQVVIRAKPDGTMQYSQDWLNWADSLDVNAPAPVQTGLALDTPQAVTLFDGIFSGDIGDVYTVFTGYRLADGTLVYNGGQPFTLQAVGENCQVIPPNRVEIVDVGRG